MSLGYGLAAAAVTLGLESILVKPKRAIGPFVAHVTISERHVDELDIVDHPVEQGSPISDHAIKRPAEVTIECGWSNSPPGSGSFLSVAASAAVGVLGLGGTASLVGSVASGVSSLLQGTNTDQVRDTYNKLRALQAARVPFDVFTGKVAYKNMLFKSLIVETDREHENALLVTAVLREVFIASVTVVSTSSDPADLADPEGTLPVLGKGIKQLSSSVKSLNLSSAIDAITPSGLSSVTGGF